jgi:DNA-directed RNA polymerase specialized sigma24 family protein
LSGTSSDDYGCTQEKFDRLLAWLNPDRDEAAKQHMRIGFKLLKYFERRLYLDQRPCVDAAALADKTMDRVCCKMPELADTYVGEPIAYFYGVAKNVYEEYRKKKPLPNPPPQPEPDVDTELRHKCLEDCLKNFGEEDRDLLLQYYQDDKTAKINHRKALAEKFKISLNTLRMRIYRLKETLGECIFDCMKKAQA